MISYVSVWFVVTSTAEDITPRNLLVSPCFETLSPFSIPVLCVHKEDGKMQTYCFTLKFLCTDHHNFNQIHLLLHVNLGSVNLIILVYIQL